MSGTMEGGKLAAERNKQSYGHDFYAKIGRKGGKAYHKVPRGFAADKQRAREAGAKGGTISKRRPAK